MGEDSQARSAERLVANFLTVCGRSRREAAETLWELGAEKLRRTAGDVDSLERLLGNELFSPLVSFERVESEPLERIQDSARQLVTAFPAEGEPARFLFALKRSSLGDAVGRWLVTGVEREW